MALKYVPKHMKPKANKKAKYRDQIKRLTMLLNLSRAGYFTNDL